MEKFNECRFCNIWKGQYMHPEFDKPFLKNESYMAIVSIGAFVEGWSLVIPKEHTYSMRTFYEKESFLNFVSDVVIHIKNIYQKPVIVFEHGANRCDSKTSCGTHHAHLHIVPYENSLLPTIIKDRNWIKIPYNQVQETVGASEYLLYADLDENLRSSEFYIHILDTEESQYFRRIIAQDSGISDYSYKSAPFLEETIKSYKALKENE